MRRLKVSLPIGALNCRRSPQASPGAVRVRGLAQRTEEQCATVDALVSDLRDEQIIYTSNPTIADQPGLAAHNLGSISALLSLENHLEHILRGGESRDDVT